MTTVQLIQISVQIGLILLGVYLIAHEKELIRFERKAWKYIKAFFKALYYTITHKEETNNG